MEQEELMVGDLVHTFNGFNLYVCEIMKDHVCCSGYSVFNYNNISPIPLTEEILKANGFTHEDGLYCWEYYCGEKDYFILHCGMNGEPPYSIEIARRRYIPNIESVHELQHALRVCGLNELASNFKIK